MGRTLEQLEAEIRELNTDQRMRLIRDLIADLDGAPDAEIDRTWLTEAERRYQEITDGAVEPIGAEEVFAKARAKFGR
jgi:putative addiction module component (TIGR02574 family)